MMTLLSIGIWLFNCWLWYHIGIITGRREVGLSKARREVNEWNF